MSRISPSLLLSFVATCAALQAQPGASPANVLVVVNDRSSLSRSIGEYYVRKRGIPLKNLCRIQTSEDETIARPEYDRTVAAPIAACLRKEQLVEQVLYVVLAQGVPLRIPGREAMDGDFASVDSELALLYTDLHSGKSHAVNGPIKNPFFGKSDTPFSHPEFPMYLVTRLAAYDFTGVKVLIDKALLAKNRGKFVIDMKSDDDEPGNNWLRDTVIRLPKDRVVFDDSAKVLYKQMDVIGFASWGSNDKNRHERFVGFQWLPGAIATEFVSSDGRSFARPPKAWTISDWESRSKWFAGSPQTLSADYLEEGASAATGHVYEPYLAMTPRPDLLLPAYFRGRSLAESYYLSIPALSWQNIVVGDPLMTLGPPGK